MVDISEKNFEQTIEMVLIGEAVHESLGGASPGRESSAAYGIMPAGGYRKRAPEDYDKRLCLIAADVLDFIYATQPKEWDKFKKQHGPDAKDRLLARLASEVRTRGTLEVLRKGIKSDGCSFRLGYFRPASGLNEELQKLYEANLFTAVRQLKYSEANEKSLDLVLFLNGLPIFTAELKNSAHRSDRSGCHSSVSA